MENPHGPEAKETETLSGSLTPEKINPALAISELAVDTEAKPSWRTHIRLGKILLFGLSLYLFVLAIDLLKTGARGITPSFSRSQYYLKCDKQPWVWVVICIPDYERVTCCSCWINIL